MHLLASATLELHEFPENALPAYAILSHTWGDSEVSYNEMLQPSAATRAKDGYIKIKNFATLVSLLGWKYIWVDTCCIRKDSTAEVSEAINTMFRWYAKARRCYVYLDDMEGYFPECDFTNEGDDRKQEAFQQCRWLTRGWTLQELIAPHDVHFYSKDWTFLFTKHQWASTLSLTLGISQEVLLTSNTALASVSQRMSWAANRVTTRPEDVAYCLLGIFHVNMPMLYGEGGEKAFIRLQEEIMRSSDDHSLFAWRGEESYSSYSGLLAPSPNYFILSQNTTSVDNTRDDEPYSITNKGISLKLDLIPYRVDPSESDVFIALLNCRDPGPQGDRVGICLKKLGNNQYARIEKHRLFNTAELDAPHLHCPLRVQIQRSDRTHFSDYFEDYDEITELSDLSDLSTSTLRIGYNPREDQADSPRLMSNTYNFEDVSRITYVPSVDQDSDRSASVEMPTKSTRIGASISGFSDTMLTRRNSHWSSDSEDDEPPPLLVRRHSHWGSDSDDDPPAPAAKPTNLYVRQNIRLPTGHSTPRVYGFMVTELIHVSDIYLSDVWPANSWDPRQKFLRILPHEKEKGAVICYSYLQDESFGTLAIVLRWDRKSRKFGTSCIHDISWLAAMPDEGRMLGLEGLVGRTRDETALSIAGGRHKAKVEMDLGMSGDDVVIKVGITIR